MPSLDKDSFSAWIDKMSGNNHLIVKGVAEVPTGGWKGSLKPANPQGTNEYVLILEAELEKPTGIVTQVISKIELRYDENPPAKQYTDVTIRYDGSEFSITVGETH